MTEVLGSLKNLRKPWFVSLRSAMVLFFFFFLFSSFFFFEKRERIRRGLQDFWEVAKFVLDGEDWQGRIY